MPSSLRSTVLALGVVTALVSGCTADGERSPGDPVTTAEARSLARVLLNDYRAGGADFVVTAPFGDSALLTLTGEIDFRRSVGRAEAVTSTGESRTEDTRTVFFTRDDLWFGQVPGLSDALAAAGLPSAVYVRRPVAGPGEDPELIDVLVQVLLNLASSSADNPRAFTDGGYTWQGQRSVDGRLTSLFRLHEGRTVAVAPSGDLLVQYETPLQDGGVEVTVTLSGHGPRRVDVPAEEETISVEDQPALMAGLGL